MAAVESAGSLHVLIKARSPKHGQWIERTLEQPRKGMVGIEVNEHKDPSEKQHNVLPNLAGSASHPTWEAAAFKPAGSLKDSKQLVHPVATAHRKDETADGREYEGKGPRKEGCEDAEEDYSEREQEPLPHTMPSSYQHTRISKERQGCHIQ